MIGGFDLRDISCETEDGLPIFTARRLSLDFFLPSFLAGYPGIREFVIDTPVIHLIQKGEHWNYEALIPAGEKKTETESSSLFSSGEIKLPFSIKAFLGARIENSGIVYRSETGSGLVQMEMHGLTIRTGFITKKIDHIPLNVSFLDIFQTLVLSINPDSPLQIHYQAKDEITGPATASFQFFREQKEDTGELVSRLLFDTGTLKKTGRGTFPLPHNWFISYDLFYDRERDRLVLNDFRLKENQLTKFYFQASVNHLLTGNRDIDFQIQDSTINLEVPGRLLSYFRGLDQPVFEGEFIVKDLEIKGPFEKAKMGMFLQGRKIIYRGPGIPQRMEISSLKATGSMDLYRLFPSGKKPDGYDGEKTLTYGIFHRLDLLDLSGTYNDGNLKGTGVFTPENGCIADLRIWSFPMDQYSAPYFTGDLSADLHMESNETFRDMWLTGGISVRNSRYMSGNSRSGINHLFLRTRGHVVTTAEDVSVLLHDSELSATNDREKPTLFLRGFIGMVFGKTSHDYDLKIQELTINYNDLKSALPSSLRYSMSSYESYLRESPVLSSDLQISLAKTKKSYKGDLLVKIPALRIDDLAIRMDMDFTPTTMEFRDLTIRGMNKTLFTSLKGSSVFRDRVWHQDMKFDLRMEGKELVRVHPQMELQGLLDIDMALNDRKASGTILAQNLDLNLNSSGCIQNNPDNPCQNWMIRQVNMDLPFVHDLNAKGSNVSAGFQESFASGTTGLLSSANFVIRTIASDRYPSGRIKEGDPFYLVGSPEAAARNGLEARIHYRNNILFLDRLEGIIFRDTNVTTERGRWIPFGTIYGKQIYYNLANLKMENQGYGMHLQVKQFDLAPYLKGAQEGNDGIISGDIQATGHDLREPLYNTRARVSIHRLSTEFSGFVTRIMVPVDMVAWAANSTLVIPSVRVELKEGLVYSSITVRRGGVFSLMIRPDTEEIKQDRVPLARFLERAQNESGELNKGGG